MSVKNTERVRYSTPPRWTEPGHIDEKPFLGCTFQFGYTIPNRVPSTARSPLRLVISSTCAPCPAFQIVNVSKMSPPRSQCGVCNVDTISLSSRRISSNFRSSPRLSISSLRLSPLSFISVKRCLAKLSFGTIAVLSRFFHSFLSLPLAPEQAPTLMQPHERASTLIQPQLQQEQE